MCRLCYVVNVLFLLAGSDGVCGCLPAEQPSGECHAGDGLPSRLPGLLSQNTALPAV